MALCIDQDLLLSIDDMKSKLAELETKLKTALERQKEEEALQEKQQRLTHDLEAISRIHKISTCFVRDGEFNAVLDKILEVAVYISGAQKGTLQLMRPGQQALKVVAQVGFDRTHINFFSSISHDSATVCGAALKRKERTIVEDVTKNPILAGTKALDVYLAAGVRAVQATLLMSRKGEIIGILSTHWDTPCRPDDNVLSYMDMLARQASDIIEKEWADEDRMHMLQDADEQNSRLRALMDALPVGVWVAEANGSLSITNRAAADFYGGCAPLADSTKEYKVYRVFRPDSGAPIPTEEHPLSRALRGEIVTDMVMDFERFDGTRGTQIASAAPIRNTGGDILGGVAVAMDITALKQAEAALKENERKAQALIKKLEDEDKNKNQFISILSHELRNPLATIVAGLSLLNATDDKQKTQKAAEIIKRQISQLCKLVDDLLDVTRINQNKIQLKRETLQLNKILLNIVDDMKLEFKNKGVHFWVKIQPLPLFIDADRVRITQCIGNILVNALKFTTKKGAVWLTLEKKMNEAVISVQDNGIGISPEMIQHLFKPFMQVDLSLDRLKNNGLGLGLSIVKNIIEMHGGTVTAHSDGIGRGALFTIRLPMSEKNKSMNNAVSPRDHIAFKVLIIDSSQGAVSILCSALDIMGHQSYTASNGKEGLIKAREIQPDIIFYDIGLTDKNSNAVARRLKGDTRTKKACLIALTSHTSEDQLTKARQRGFDRYLVKPVDMSDLEKILTEMPQILS